MKKYFLLGLVALFFVACENTQTTPASQPLPILLGDGDDITDISNKGVLPPLVADPEEEVDALTLYENSCASCHGLYGDGGAGPQISGKDEAYLLAALSGYSKGAYGSSEKSTMENVVKNLTSIQLLVLSVYISGL